MLHHNHYNYESDVLNDFPCVHCIDFHLNILPHKHHRLELLQIWGILLLLLLGSEFQWLLLRGQHVLFLLHWEQEGLFFNFFGSRIVVLSASTMSAILSIWKERLQEDFNSTLAIQSNSGHGNETHYGLWARCNFHIGACNPMGFRKVTLLQQRTFCWKYRIKLNSH